MKDEGHPWPADDEPKAIETAEGRRERERIETAAELEAIQKAHVALQGLSQDALRRALSYLHDRLEYRDLS